MMDVVHSTSAGIATPADVFEDLFPTKPQVGFYFNTECEYGYFDGWDDDILFSIIPGLESPLDQITGYDEIGLTEMARVIALSHEQYLKTASQADQIVHVHSSHAFGISLRITKRSTLIGLVGRLSDARWWRRQINRVADQRREHLAQMKRQLGRAAGEQCCSAATMSIMKARKAKTDAYLSRSYKAVSSTLEYSKPVVFNLLEVARSQQANRINELYLDIKAMEEIASGKGWGWLFLTLTAPGEFHSNPAFGRNSYNPKLSPRDANIFLGKDWKAIRGALKEQGFKPSDSYFGFRVTEVHEDGCPHWHVLIFHESGVAAVVEKTMGRLYNDRPGSYFEKNKDKIIRIGLTKDNPLAASAASYIFNYLCFALSGGDDSSSSSTAYKYQCAVKAMGARQYQLFGIRGSHGKLRALAKVKRLPDCPPNILQLATRLHVDKGVEGRKETQLKARMDFLLSEASKVTFIKELGLNDFGESVERIIGLKHQDDDSGVMISGFCEDIDEKAAVKILEQALS
ncbi:replication endonuclease [Pseudomonas phoenicis]|uniref:replication endonuclease n=1 Tax=unclassified Pseudomonas TaxID=196821 RepID=UPI0039A03BC8